MNEEAQDITGAPPVEQEPDSLVPSGVRRVTVLQVLPSLGAGGGVERGTVEIARAIVEAGGRSLVASAGGLMVHDLTRAKAEHFALPVDSKNPLVMRANIARLARLIVEENVDIVHARSRAPAWSACYAAARTGRRFVTTFHGTYGAGNPLKRKYNSIMTRGERVIAISSFIAGHVHQIYGVPAARIRVIPRGVDLERFDPARVSAERVAQLASQWRLGDGLPVIMLPGRLTRWKGQTVFLEAIARLGRKDIRCVLVGSDQGRADYRRELEDIISRHDLGEVVRIVDHCADMPAAYMLTDVVVSASTDPEAFGRVVPEAQALGRPVIASDHGGARETIIEGETGWLTPPGDAQTLAATLQRVLEIGPEARQGLAERAITYVRANFSKDAMCDKTLDVYNEVLNLKPGE
ncbi:MAG: glycosyltransferase family 4 protein [Rhodospirillales bacterium]|nr:glycosyltransferase family 4 protein [Rhodospirillales bacterium]